MQITDDMLAAYKVAHRAGIDAALKDYSKIATIGDDARRAGIAAAIASANPWRPIAEADKDIAYIHDLAGLRIGGSHPIWVRDEDGRVYEALWSDDGKRAYWWDIEGESPVDPVEFMPHPLDPRFADASEPKGSEDG